MKGKNPMNTLRRYKWFTLAIVMAITLLGVQSANAIYDPNDPNVTYDPNDPNNYVEGQLLIRFEPIGMGEYGTYDSVLEAAGGGDVLESYDSLVPKLYLVDLPEGMTVDANMAQYNNAEGIMYAVPNHKYQVQATTPNDTYFSYLWGMHNTGQTVNGKSGTADADIDAPEAWDTAISASSIVVAVIDTGVDYGHEDLAGNMWTNANSEHGYDFVNDDNDPMDDYGHGTHCAGTIGALGNNGKGVVGVCWEVQIMAVKVFNQFGGGKESHIIDGIKYAVDNGADIMSNSWGGRFPKPPDPRFPQALYEAVQAAEFAGVVFVASAGNDGIDNDTNPYPAYPASFDLDGIISVMATDQDDVRSVWNPWRSSNYGADTVDLAAPGSNIYSCKKSGGYWFAGGTSMACPHVSGACALYLAEKPGSDIEDVKNSVLDSVDDKDLPCVSEGRLNLDALLDVNDGNSNDIDPATFDWGDVSDFMAFYMKNSAGNGYWGAKKYVKATYGLIPTHCKTAAGTLIPHYHFEVNFNTTQKTDSNRYWDWYYTLIGGSSARISDASNLVASLANAMDGYGGSGSANFDYWLVPCEKTDKIFTDDCTFWQGPPTSCRADDRIAYNDDNYVYQHATIINSIDGNNEPDQIEWKCQHSGVYQYDNGGVSEPFATPACPGTQPDGSPPTGTWDPDYWDTDKADVYYD